MAQAVKDGDLKEILQAQRREILAALGDEKGVARVALHRQLTALSREIESLKVAADTQVSVVAHTADESWDGSVV